MLYSIKSEIRNHKKSSIIAIYSTEKIIRNIGINITKNPYITVIYLVSTMPIVNSLQLELPLNVFF